ncbi:4'-phosphopantetheinyl transferase family protein [Streptomyces sp. NBC_01320]|uniref:4'-phosphopantetheinyl transferase family protein n=1 Tax=Streptomyces sp. NBC_01320 TaxID=2903824 RepID=UPI002E1496FF|nr:4'-phosphopantetheinyl transferase superfamily protein [Streptomyces sp. NBC_01320]
MTSPSGWPEHPVHVWTCAVSGPPDGYLRVLSADELDVAERRVGDRAEYVAAHVLLRTALSWWVPRVPPHAWVFVRSPLGRPEIAEPRAYRWLRFNVSHTGGLVACVLAAGTDCGIDVETVRRRTDTDALARRVLSSGEYAGFAGLPDAVRAHRFLQHWVLKEAYAKARGLGLRLPFDACGFLLGPGPLRAELPDAPQPWRFQQWRPTPWHVAALALRGGEGRQPQPVHHGAPPTGAGASSPRSVRIAETTGGGADLR